jgi:hypothetical protein
METPEPDVTLAEPETVEVETREEKLHTYIAGRVTDSTAVEESDEPCYQATEVETGETPEDPPPEVAEEVEGPSLAMKAAAAGWINPSLVETAVNDAQLSTWIRMAQDQQQQQQQQPQEPALEETPPPEPEALLPEDEFPADDPVRKAMETMKGQNDALTKDVETLINIVSSLSNDQQAVTENANRSNQKIMDDAMDKVGGSLGEFGKLDEFSGDLRKAGFDRLETMKKNSPTVPHEELVEQYLLKAGYTKPTPGPGPIKKAARSKLGGPNNPPAVEPPLSREEKVSRLLRQISDRR